MKKFKISAFVCASFIAIAASPMTSVYAHHILPKHNLNCSKDFPCPKELQRRIDFWIQVFREWGKEKAIFHDPDAPERVYSIVETGKGCSSSVKTRVQRERKHIKTALYNAASKIDSGSKLNSTDQHFANLFPRKNSKQMRNAAENIRCQSGVKDGYVAGLKRFNRYHKMVDKILAQYNLPPDIRYLPFVESSYNPAAYSKAGAAGMWQIMPKTARSLGLELNATVDERLDPEAATHGAAKYLSNSRKSLTELAKTIDPSIRPEQISPFVITSYNYGVNGMRRAIKSVKPDYMSVLKQYKSAGFQIAVKNFYSSFLAARHVALNADQYFGQITPTKALDYHTVVLSQATSMDRIKSVFDVAESTLKPINPGLTRFVWNGWRLIPAGYQLKLPNRTDAYQGAVIKLQSLPPEAIASGSNLYIVRRGDTACGVARALKVNCRELININRLGKKAVIRVGQKLEIPKKLVVVTQKQGRGPDQTIIARDDGRLKQLTYRVKRGDSACLIAERHDVSCRSLISSNRLNRTATIYVGQKLIIPGAVEESDKIAGLDENNRYLVRKGDNACAIAERFSVSCNELKQLNKLSKKATIYPGQRITIPGLVIENTTETARKLAQVDETIAEVTKSTAGSKDADNVIENDSLSNLLDTLPDLSVMVAESSGQPTYRILAEADETLGHFADWLGVGSSRVIRKFNGLPTNAVLRVGQALKLPITSAKMVEQFEQKRIEYHQILSESLKSHYTLVGISQYKVQPGDSVWSLSNESGFPTWLFYRLNPALKISSLKNGQIILLPKLREM